MPSMTSLLLPENIALYESEIYNLDVEIEEIEGDLSNTAMSAYTTPPPSPKKQPEEPGLMDPTCPEASGTLQKMKKFFSLPSPATPFEVFRLGEIFSPFSEYIPFREPALPRHIVHTSPRSHGKPRLRQHLRRVSSNEDILARLKIIEEASKLDWSTLDVDDHLIQMSSAKVVEPNGIWEADESIWDEIEDAPKTTTRIIRKWPTMGELVAYGHSEWKRHKVSILKLSPLRNETIVKDEVEDEWDEVSGTLGYAFCIGNLLR